MIAHRLNHRSRILLLIIVISGSLVLLAGHQSLAYGSNGAGTVTVGTGNLNFGTVTVGQSVRLPDTISNYTSSSITIDKIEGLEPAFQVTGISLPVVLAPGQSVPFAVRFQPTKPGNPSATIAFAGQNSEPIVSVSASGSAVGAPTLSANPSPVYFGHILVGANITRNVGLENYGDTPLTITQATLSGAGFSMANLSLPLTLKPHERVRLILTFSPPQIGDLTGSISLATYSANQPSTTRTLVLSLFGRGITTAATLVPSPATLTFGNIQVGSTASLTETLTNTGAASITIAQATSSTPGFSISGLATPVTLGAGQSTAFKVVFTPSTSGAATGTINISSLTAGSGGTVNESISVSGTAIAAGALNANPSNANFGNVMVGSNQTLPVTVANTGASSVTLSSAAAAGTGFKLSSTSLPITLSAGQSTTLSVVFAPSAAGTASGSLTIGSNASNATLSVPLTGMAVTPGQLGSSPSSVAFGNIQVGTSKSLSGTLTNSGGSSLTISAAAASGTGFSLSGLTLPVTLSAGQSASFSVSFSPTASGSATGSISVTSTGSDSSLSIPLSAAGVTPGTVAANPASLAFGNIQVNGNTTLPATITNTGGSSLIISAAAASGAGFSLSGLSLPLTLNAGQSASFTVAFSPTTSGAAAGSVNITSNGSNTSLSIPLSGTGLAAASLTSNPASLAFGNVQVNGTTNLSETITNSGGSSITISQASAAGAGFSISGLTLPTTLAANQSVTFTASFAPTSAGAASGTLSVVSNASNSTLNVALSGTGTGAGQIAVSPTSLSFGKVNVGSSGSLNGTITASGGTVQVTSASSSNGQFEITGISLPVTIAAGQSASFSVTFTPQASGAVSGSVSFSSNASNSSVAEALTGTGVAAVQHNVALTWNSANEAVGYNVYRGTVSGGPYTMVNSTLDGTTSYTDNSVASGQTYYYVATSVDINSNESAYSKQTTAVVPTP